MNKSVHKKEVILNMRRTLAKNAGIQITQVDQQKCGATVDNAQNTG